MFNKFLHRIDGMLFAEPFETVADENGFIEPILPPYLVNQKYINSAKEFSKNILTKEELKIIIADLKSKYKDFSRTTMIFLTFLNLKNTMFFVVASSLINNDNLFLEKDYLKIINWFKIINDTERAEQVAEVAFEKYPENEEISIVYMNLLYKTEGYQSIYSVFSKLLNEIREDYLNRSSQNFKIKLLKVMTKTFAERQDYELYEKLIKISCQDLGPEYVVNIAERMIELVKGNPAILMKTYNELDGYRFTIDLANKIMEDRELSPLEYAETVFAYYITDNQEKIEELYTFKDVSQEKYRALIEVFSRGEQHNAVIKIANNAISENKGDNKIYNLLAKSYEKTNNKHEADLAIIEKNNLFLKETLDQKKYATVVEIVFETIDFKEPINETTCEYLEKAYNLLDEKSKEKYKHRVSFIIDTFGKNGFLQKGE